MRPPSSLWWSTLGECVAARSPLRGDRDVDVAIVGGGFTGLWTARELVRRDPTLRIAVLEQSVCGFGASGRNGGWASALYPLSDAVVRGHYGDEAANHLRLTLQRAVIELGSALDGDDVDAHFHRGGTIVAARSSTQEARLRASVDSARASGVGDGDLAWLGADQARERLNCSDLYGATFTPHCARVHPGRLVRGLASVNEQLGVEIYEDTHVTRIEPATSRRRASALTPFGEVRANYVVRATEAYSAALSGERRSVVPLFSLMVATEPLSDSFFDRAGLSHYETFADDRNLIIYGQRTKDNRLAFGGRGAPYHFGSTIEPRFDANDRVFGLLATTLHELFPFLEGSISHRWGGPLAMPRDHSPFVHIDHARGLAAAGGYTGDGVVLSRVAASALADLIVAPDVETEFTRLPFAHHVPRRWEFEPLRWIGINAGLALATRADHVDVRHDRSSRAIRVLDRLYDSFPP